jgi:hypothetical protein
MLKAGRTWASIGYWRDGTVDTVLERWTRHEEWVLAIKANRPDSIVTVRFEDLLASPGDELRRILAFLGLRAPADVLLQCAVLTRAPAATRDEIALAMTISPRTAAVMAAYRYS